MPDGTGFQHHNVQNLESNHIQYAIAISSKHNKKFQICRKPEPNTRGEQVDVQNLIAQISHTLPAFYSFYALELKNFTPNHQVSKHTECKHKEKKLYLIFF